MITPLMADIASYLQKQVQEQLLTPRQSRTYNGAVKTVGGFPVPPSPPKASGTLVRNTKVYWTEDFNEETETPTLVIDFGAAENYAYFVDQGRRPGKYPPVAPIDRWVVTKGLKGIRNDKGQFISRKSTVFLIRRSIGMYGFQGTNFIQKAIDNSLNKIADDMGQAAEEFLIKYLEEKGTIIPL